MDNMKPVDAVKFTYSSGFKETCESLMKTFDHSMEELHKVVTGRTTAPDEYAVCNSEYKFRYISPENIAEYVSNLIKVLEMQMIGPNVTDVERFSVESACRFVGENDCDPFKWGTINANGTYTRDDMGLNDLVVYCQNEFFEHVTLNRFEMNKRREFIKKDYDKLNGIHFSANVRKMIDAIPNLIKKTNFVNMEYTERRAIETFIENFVLFAITLNIATCASMIMYCVPRSTYNTALQHHPMKVDDNSLLDNEYFKESVDTTANKPVYVLVMDTHSKTSIPIKAWTHSKYMHASLSLDPNLDHMYSFTIRKDGFTVEDLRHEPEFSKAEGAIYAAYVTNQQFSKLKHYLEKMEKETKKSDGENTAYNWDLIKNILTFKDVNDSDDYHQICTSFVNNIFKVIDVTLTDKNIATAEDIHKSCVLKSDQFFKVFDGKLTLADPEDIKRNVEMNAHKAESKTINEYVTECCLLKTNNIVCKNKIPFNINMRDIVLQDMHPNFKDTVSAINFIMKDTRSPFAHLIWKYGSINLDNQKINPDMIVRMFLGHPCCACDTFSNYAKLYNDIDFHTDVNWLDKITYGDIYQSSNYRADAMGNDHKHPIQITLEMLYKMYGDRRCKTNQDLADNIEIVGDAMIGIARIYKDCGIENWELVRDILAVFGEIMTKCMIRLYNNHMAIIVVSDDMDDTMIPGYMYTESFVMEADNTKPTVTVTNKDSVSNKGNSTGKQLFAKGKEFLKQSLTKFSGWVTDALAKVPQKFVDVHKAESNWITKHADLSSKIGTEIGSAFSPHVENWPAYKIPLNELTSANVSIKNVIDKYVQNPSQNFDANTIRKEFYDQFPTLKGQIQVGDPNKEAEAISNYVLYSNPNVTNDEKFLKLQPGDQASWQSAWNNLCNDIEKTPDALKTAAKKISDDLNQASKDVLGQVNKLKENNKQNEQQKTESTSTNNTTTPTTNTTNTATNTNANNANSATPPVTKESYVDSVNYGDLFTEADGTTTGGLSEAQLTTMNNALTELSKVWAVNTINALANKFYRTSYNLYRDLVNAYQQSGGKFTDQQQQTQNNTNNAETPQTAEEVVDSAADASQQQGQSDK